MMGTEVKELPLSGIKVLEFGHAVMGPAGGVILADMGAEVIHIEPTGGDATRRLKGFGIGYFPYFNRNKKSLAINIKTPEAKEIIHRLVESADVLLENFGPGTMDRLGFSYEALSKVNPRLIYCSLKGFLPGPYEKRIAMDEIVQMMGGLAYMTGPPGKPLRAGTSIIDVTGGMFAVIGVLTALIDRKRTGKGTLVKSALFETTAFVMGQHMAYAALTDGPVPPMSARVSAWSIYRLFESKDGEHVFIGIISEKHWGKFCKAFDRMDLFQDERLGSNNGRIDQRRWLLPEIENMIKRFTKEDVVQRCEQAGVPFAPIAKPEDLFDDPQLNQASGLLETTFPSGEKTKMPRIPFQIEPYDFNLRMDPPDIGAHTRETLEGAGYNREEIAQFLDRGVVTTLPDMEQ